MKVTWVPDDALSSHVIVRTWEGNGAGVSGSMKVWATSHTCRSCDILPEQAHNLIVFLFCFCWFCFFFVLILQPSSLTLQKDLSTDRPAPQTEMNTSSASSISLLFVSLSLNVFFFSLSMKAPGRSPDNPRRRNDTRYSLSRRLCAQHSRCFCCWAIRRYDRACFEKEKKKKKASQLPQKE